MADEVADYRQEVIRQYRDEVKKYSQDIRMGDASTHNYDMLFNAYWRLYEFSIKDDGKPDFDKETVDKVCNQLLVKIKKDITDGIADGFTYCYLADVYTYRENKEKALECFDKAVSIDESFNWNRGEYKNYVLNDREGALEDYNKALAVAKDQDTIDLINDSIKSIDLIRKTDEILAETDKTLRNMKIKSLLIFGALILYILFKIYVIFFTN
ncbi:MAG: tetratricopeptide repeat protein [Candidatus Gastranaerophilaceae bacterium]